MTSANNLELHYYLPSNDGLAVCSIVDKQGLLITEVSAERTGIKSS